MLFVSITNVEKVGNSIYFFFFVVNRDACQSQQYKYLLEKREIKTNTIFRKTAHNIFQTPKKQKFKISKGSQIIFSYFTNLRQDKDRNNAVLQLFLIKLSCQTKKSLMYFARGIFAKISHQIANL